MSKKTLSSAIELIGSQVELAAQLRFRLPGCRVQQAHISKWLLRSRAEVPPAEYVVPIAEIVGWRVTPHELRPDLYPNPHDALPPGLVAAAQSKAAAT